MKIMIMVLLCLLLVLSDAQIPSSTEPSEFPSIVPSVMPTDKPTVIPTAPTIRPSSKPSAEPTIAPTKKPTESPTKKPSSEPTILPTRMPTNEPTIAPTRLPTNTPSINPTSEPSSVPTKIPTGQPTYKPSAEPSYVPTKNPTREPTSVPTRLPTSSPTSKPTVEPTVIPTKKPTCKPTSAPTRLPTNSPTVKPSVEPTSPPTKKPTSEPTSAHSYVLYSYPVSSLISAGYTVCYSEPYSTATTTTALSACYGGTSYFVGAISSSSPSTFRLGAYGTAGIFTATYSTTTAYLDPYGAYWYDYSGKAFGFADTSTITLNSCDVAGTDCASRLCWHLDNNNGGYRAGCTYSLNSDSTWTKVIYRYTGPPVSSPTPSPSAPPLVPTNQPSFMPSSVSPSNAPSSIPSAPSAAPSLSPTFAPTVAPTSLIERGAVRMYTFSESSLSDSSPNGRGVSTTTGLEAPNGLSFVTGVDGTPNSAVYLNGNQQYLRTSSEGIPSGTKSVSLWVKLDSINGLTTPNVLMNSHPAESSSSNHSVHMNAVVGLGMYIMGFGVGGCGSAFLLVMNNKDGGAVFEVQSRCASLRVSVAPGTYKISDFVGQWHHMAVTTSAASGTSIYINSNLVAHVSQGFCNTNVSVNQYLALGTIPSPAGAVPYYDEHATFLHGALDDVLICNTTLSAAEVSNIFVSQFTKSPTFSPTISPTLAPTSKPISRSSTFNILAVSVAVPVGALFAFLVGIIVFCGFKRGVTLRSLLYRAEVAPARFIELTVGQLTFLTQEDIVAATNNFDISLFIARGSTAEVFRGRMGSRDVAIKRFDSTITRSTVIHQQLVRELEMYVNFQHPHLLLLLGACADPSCLCLVSPLMSMGTLADLMANPQAKSNHIADWRIRIRLGINVMDALEYLHTSTPSKPQVVHRDVKLTNILLRNNTDTGLLEAVLIDLGIARVFQDSATVGAQTIVMGTHGYIDPQYAAGLGVNKSSDIFALGVVLLQLLTGSPVAFDSSLPVPALYLRMRQTLGEGRGSTAAEPNLWHPEIAEYLGWLVFSCTSDLAFNRPVSCRMISETLHNLLDFEPAPAPIALHVRLRAPLPPPRPTRECTICFGENGPINCRLLPCMHSCLCLADAQYLLSVRQNCPLCRRPIQSIQEGIYEHTNTAI